MDGERYDGDGVDIYIENLDNILLKINDLIGDGNDTSTMLDNASEKFNISGIKPKELLNDSSGTIPNYTIPNDLKDLKGKFLECLSNVKSYFDMVYANESGSSPSVGEWNVGDVPQNSGGGNNGSDGEVNPLTITGTPSDNSGGGNNGSDGEVNPLTITETPSDDNVVVTPQDGTTIIPEVPETDNENNPENDGSNGEVSETKPTDTDDGDKTFKPSKDSGTLIVSKDGVTTIDKDGKEIGSLQKGKYQVYDTKYDDNGNPVAVRISKDGESEVWIDLTKNDVNAIYIDTSTKGTFKVKEGTINVYDENGNIIGKIGPGDHDVYDVIYDSNGNPIAIRISGDGAPERWLNIDESGISGTLVFEGQDGIYTLSDGNINVYDVSGKLVGQLIDGKYVVYDIKYDNSGNVVSIRISKDGEPERWVNIYENGKYIGNYTPTVPIEETIVLNNDAGKLSLFEKGAIAVGGIIGVLAIAAGTKMYLKNKKGEKVSNIKEGEYNVYDVAQDEEGNVTDARISPNGKEEYWVHI